MSSVASKGNPRITRRGFVGLMAASAAGALEACQRYPGPEVVSPVPPNWDRGERRMALSTCGQCPAGCGIRVRLLEGRAIGIDGSPQHPINHGGLGPKGKSGLQLLYHADRIRGPLKREGPRGSGRWRSIPWDAAIAEIAGQLRELRAAGVPRSLVVVDGEPRGMMHDLWKRFLEAYGSPNHVAPWPASDGASVLAMTLMQGVPELPAYDWQRTRYVLGFGGNLFESSCQRIHLMRAASASRSSIPRRRVRFVQVSPRFSVTAAKADEWIPIEPATDGALALGLAHVLVKEELYDKAFIEAHAFGFEDWKDDRGRVHRGFRELVLGDYDPQRVAKLTGVPQETIIRLARELVADRPAVVIADGAALAATNALGTAMAVHALNALLGNLQREGGIQVPRRAALTAWPPVTPDEVGLAGRRAPRIDGAATAACPLGSAAIQTLPEAIIAGAPYAVKAVLLYRSNPVFSKPDGRRWAEALRAVPLVVSFSPLPDESTLWADYVLPDSTYLERWELVEPLPGDASPLLGLRQPVVEPVHDTLPTGDVLIRLASALGKPLADAFPWPDYRAAVMRRMEAVANPGGGPVSESTLAAFQKKLANLGYLALPSGGFEDWRAAFRTPSRKFEFFSQSAAARVANLFPDESRLERFLARQGIVTRADALFMPHWEPARRAGEADDYPFVLDAYRGIEYAVGGARHLPWLLEMPTAGAHAWSERVELHPADAGRLGIRDGDEVTVESPAGKRRLHARVLPGIRPGTVGLPLGHGPWPPTPSDGGAGSGSALLADLTDGLAGLVATHGTRVRIRKEPAA
jgi:anaerobic selenocysteine-containing dehydrogenase